MLARPRRRRHRSTHNSDHNSSSPADTADGRVGSNGLPRNRCPGAVTDDRARFWQAIHNSDHKRTTPSDTGGGLTRGQRAPRRLLALEAPPMSMTAADLSLANPFEEPVLRWDEDRTEFRRSLLIDATSYRPEPLFPLPPQVMPTTQLVSPSGRFSYANRILPAGRILWTADPKGRQGTVRFTGDVVIPTLY